LTHNPLVQVLFVMKNTPQACKDFGGLRLSPLGVSSTSRFDLVLFINDPDGAPSATWMYNPNLFDTSTITRIAEMYQVLLGTVITESAAPLSRLHEVLSEAERRLREAVQKSFQETSLRKLRGARRRNIIASSDTADDNA
jgi:hypothetical protein